MCERFITIAGYNTLKILLNPLYAEEKSP